MRYYGNAHLGKRRFDIAKDLVFAAIRSLQMAKGKCRSRLERSQRSDSRESLTSMMSDAGSTPGESENLEEKEKSGEDPIQNPPADGEESAMASK